MDFSIGNLGGTNANISSMISQLIAKKTSSMNSLLDQRTSIENALATLQNSSLGIGSINNSYSSQIASLQDSIDAMKEQYTINANKLNTINSLNNSYNKTVSTLDDYIQSLKNPNPNDSIVSGSSSNGNVAGVTVDNSANPQRIELSVSQLATCSVLKSAVISGTSISGSTKITDLFAGKFDSASNTITSLRTDISESMKLSELGVKSGSFKLGSRVINVKSDETVGDLINKINADSNYTAKIDKATGAFTISAKSGSSVAITNAVGDLNVTGNLTTTTKLEDLGIKSGAYFVGGVQIDVADGDTVGVLIDKLEAEGFNASVQTDTNNPSSKVLNITDSNGNKVSTEGTNFASAAGFTVSEGTFSINGETFTIGSDTTIDDLLYQINKATDDGVGAILKDGQIILTASKTGAVEINVEKGSSNFTNAVGFTTGGVMNTGNLVMGSDGSYVTLKGLNSGIKGSDIAKADGSGKFTSGNFLISYSKIDDLGNATDEMLTTEINVEDGDTIDDIIQRIKNQTTQKYTDSDGVERTNYLQAEIVDGHFQIRQTAKGADFDIAVSAGSSTFTNYVGLTKDVGTGVSTSGSATTYTGVNAVTDSTKFTEGSFKITASLANNPTKTETVTIEVGANETLQSVMDKINNSGLAIRAQLVTGSDGTQRLQLVHNNYGSGYQISVEAGDTNFTNVVGFTTSVSTGVSNDGTNSTLTGVVTGLDKNTTGYKEGSFVISTNKLSSDGKTASSEMASAIIEVDSSMSLQDIMDKINSATYKDASGNDVDLGLRASLTSDGRIQISQIHGGEGFDIKVEAGDTDFTQAAGLTKDVSVGVSSGSTSTYITGTKVYDGTFTEGSFKITTNKVGDDGKASSEMISVDVNIEAGKTLAEQLDSINAQLNTIGLSASVIADGADAGKIKIEQLNSGAGFDIKIEAGSTDFTEKLGLTTQVSTGVSNDGTYAYVLGKEYIVDEWFLSEQDVYVRGSVSGFDMQSSGFEYQTITLNYMATGDSFDIEITEDDTLEDINNKIESAIGSKFQFSFYTDPNGRVTIWAYGDSEMDQFSITATGDFLEKTGLDVDNPAGVTTGDFTVTTNKVDAEGNPLDEMQSVTVHYDSSMSLEDNIVAMNNQLAAIGLSMTAEGGMIKISQTNAGAGFDIKIEGGSTNFTELAGLTKSTSAATSTEGTSAKITGSAFTDRYQYGLTEGYFTITSGKVGEGVSATIHVEAGDSVGDVINKINNSGLDITAYLHEANYDPSYPYPEGMFGNLVIEQNNAGPDYFITVEAGNTNFTQVVGITSNVTTGVSNEAQNATLTGAIGSLDTGMTFTEGEFVITTNDVTHGTQEGYFADPNKFLSTTISVAKGDTLQDVIDKINQQCASIGISASLTSDGKIQLSQLNGGSGFTISVTAGSTNFTEKVGLTSSVSAGVSTGGSYTNITGTNNVTGPDSADKTGFDYTYTGGNKIDGFDFATSYGWNAVTSGPTGVNHTDKATAESQGYTTVSTAQELIAAFKSGAEKIMLMNDINMQGIDFETVGTFSGTFDGNGYFISNLTVENTSTYGGMFGSLDGAVIRNVGFINANVTTSDAAGILAGETTNNTVISGVYVKDSSVHADSLAFGAGALVGFAADSTAISNVMVEDTTVGGVAICLGGLVGCSYGGLTIGNSIVNNIHFDPSPIDGTLGAIGGLIGGIQDNGDPSAIRNNIVNFEYTGDAQYAGSILGYKAETGTEFNIAYQVSFSNLDAVGFGEYTESSSGPLQSFGYNDFSELLGSSSSFSLSYLKITQDSSKESGYKLSNISLESALGADYDTYKPNPASGASVTIEGSFNAGTFDVEIKDATTGSANGKFTITIQQGETVDSIVEKLNNELSAYGMSAELVDGKVTIKGGDAEGDRTIKFTDGTSNFVDYAGLGKVVKPDRITEEEAAQNGYIAIHSAQELIDAIGDGSDTAGKTFVLMNNINFSSVGAWGGFANFEGTFDGNGYFIDNLWLSGSNNTYMGLFNNVKNAVIKNLGIKDIKLSGSTTFGGVLAGQISDSTVENIVIDNVMTSSISMKSFGTIAGSILDVDINNVNLNNVNPFINGSMSLVMGGVAGTASSFSLGTGHNEITNHITNVTITNSYFGSRYDGVQSGGIVGSGHYVSISDVFVNVVHSASGSSSQIGEVAGTLYDSEVSGVVYTGSRQIAGINSNSTIHNVDVIGSSLADTICEHWESDGLKTPDGSFYVVGSIEQIFGTGWQDHLAGQAYVEKNGAEESYTTNIIEKGDFSTGNFKITAGVQGSEVTAEITVDDEDTIDDIINKINSAGLGVTASITADGKFTITSNSADPDFRIKVESGSSDFLSYVGMASDVQNTGVLIQGSDVNQFTTLTGSANVTADTEITSGSFKINGVTINVSGTIEDALSQINNYTDKTGVIAELVKNDTGKYNVVLRAEKTGTGTSIYVEGGTSNFGVVAGLTTQSVGGGAALGTEGVKQTITGSKDVIHKLTEAEAEAQGYTVIHNAQEFVDKINANKSGKFMLMGDIDLSTISYTSITNFAGTLDGNGYTIKNLGTSSSPATNGLFSSTGANAVIKNLNIENFIVKNTSSSSIAGILVGQAAGTLTVENINVSDSSVQGGLVGLIGGFQGTGYTPLNVSNIFIDQDVVFNGTVSAGSITGSAARSNLYFSNIESHAQITSDKYLGGIVGSFNSGAIEFDNILFDGDLSSSHTSLEAGALIGYVSNEDQQNRLHNIYVSAKYHDMSNPLVPYGSEIKKVNIFGTGFSDTNYQDFEFINFNYNAGYIDFGFDSYEEYKILNTEMFDNITGSRQFYSSPYTQISAGTVEVNGTTITLTAGTIDDAIGQINAKSSQTGVTAAIKDNKVVFMSDSSFTVAEGTSDFVQKTGTAGYTVNSVTESTRGDVVTGTQDLNKISAEEAEDLGYTVVTTKSELISALQANENVMLMNDIDMSGAATISTYSGILNGNGYTIKNLTNALINTTSSGTIIKNLKIDGANVNTTASYGSLLVKRSSGPLTFENIEVTNSTLTATTTYAGILLGYASVSDVLNFKNIKIADTVSVTGTSYVGGMAGGLRSSNALVQNVKVSAHIDGSNYLGGIFGVVSSDVTFDNVVSNGIITSDNNTSELYAGGFVGYKSGESSRLTFTDSYADVYMQIDESTTNSSYINQFVGKVGQSSTTFRNSYYLSSNAFTDAGEQGTATTTEKTVDSYDENWSSRKISFTEDEAVALGYTVIHNASEFRSAITSDLDGKFMLVGDIDLSTVSYSDIGNFSGTLDGNGYTIKNFTSSSSLGLFTSTQDGATFKNLTLDNIHIEDGSVESGVLVGQAYGDLTIDNVVVRNSSVEGYAAGGLVGNVKYSATNPVIVTINNVYIANDVELTSNVGSAGGVIAAFTWYNQDNIGSHLYISNVSSFAKVKSTVSGSHGAISAGGIVGATGVSTDISNVRVGGSVTSVSNSGGVIGGYSYYSQQHNATINVNNAYVTSTITNSNTDGSIGAIIGLQQKVTGNTYNISNSYYSNSSYTDMFGGTYNSSTATLAQDREFFASQYFTYWKYNPNTQSSNLPSIPLFTKGLEIAGVDISLSNGDNINTIIGKINEKTSSTGVTAEIVNGHIQFSSEEKFSLSGGSSASSGLNNPYGASLLMKYLGVEGDMYGAGVLTSSVSGLNRDTILDGLTSGTLKLNSMQSSYNTNITINAGDTLGDIIDRINDTDGFRAGIDSEGRFYIEDLNHYYNSNIIVRPEFNVDNSDTNFENLLGLGSYTTTYEDKSESTTLKTLTGSSSVTGNETLESGTFTLMLGDKSQNFTVNQGETINSILDKINASSVGISAYIENNKIVLITDEQTPDNIALKEVSGNFGTVSGLTTITNYGGESVVGHEGSYTTLTGSNKVSAPLTKAEAEAKGYVTVSTAQELRTAMLNSSTSKTIVLMNDIDMSGFGASISSFAGTIDGNGYTLKNYTNTDGLIKTTKGSVTIKNLNIDNFNVSGSSSSDYHSLLIDNTSYSVTVDSVNITNSQVNGLQHSGALIGYSSGAVSINNVSIDENTLIKASSHYGGALIGSMSGHTLSINNVYSAAQIDCLDEAGGLVGQVGSNLIGLTVKDVFIEGTINVSSTSGYSAGLIGKFTKSSSLLTDISNVIINSDFLVAHKDADSATGTFHANILSNASLSGEWIFYNADKAGSSVDAAGTNDSLTSAEIAAGYDKYTFVSNNYTQISAGTIQINGQNIMLSGGNIGTAINEINEYSSKTGVTASVEDGKVVFKNTQYGSNGISITAGTSDFVQVTGTAGYAIAAPTTTVEGGRVEGSSWISSSTNYTEAEAQALGYTVVKTAQQLITAIGSNTDKIMLVGNINFASYSGSWTIDGFDGVLDGNGYTISGLKQTLITSTTDGAVIKNLKIDGANVSNNTVYTGFLVGQAKGSITFENIEITNSALTGTTRVGALVGSVAANSVFLADNIYIGYDVTVSGSQQVGGLAGMVLSNTKSVVTNVTAAAQIQASSYLGLGGIIGYAYSDATFENVKSEGSINTTYTGSGTLYMGGFIGFLNSTKQNNIIFKDTFASVKMTKGATPSISNYDTVNQYVGYNSNISNTTYNLDTAHYRRDDSVSAGYGGTDGGEIGTGLSVYLTPYDAGFDGSWTVKSAVLSETKAAAQGYTVIHNAQEFVDKIKADLDGKFILMDNIDLSTVSYTSISNFKGTLDGNGFSIKNYTYGGSSSAALFFSTSDGAVIKNLTLDGFSVFNSSSGEANAALIAYAQGDTTIENVTVKNSEITGGGTVGALIGQSLTGISINIDNVYIDSTVEVSGNNVAADNVNAGGMIGQVASSSSILIVKNSVSNAIISNARNAGQVAGMNSAATLVQNVQTGGSISGRSIGSVFGFGYYQQDNYINNVYTSTKLSLVTDTSMDYNGAAVFANCFSGRIFNSYSVSSSGVTALYNYGNGSTMSSGNKSYSSSSLNSLTASKVIYQDTYSHASAGTVIINGVSIMLDEASLSQALGTINEYSDKTGVKAYINASNKLVFEAIEGSGKGVTITKGTSDFYKAVSSSATSISNSVTKTTGSVKLTEDTKFDGLSDGSITIDGTTIYYRSDMTVGQIIDAINSATGGKSNNTIWDPYISQKFTAGLDEQGRFFIKTDGEVSFTGNIEKFIGFEAGTAANNAELQLGADEAFSTLTGTKNVNVNSDVSSGDFYINYNGNSQKFTVGENETIQSVMDKITNSSLGVTATIQNGKIVITANEANSGRIYITDGTSNFSEMAGFTSEGAQSGTTAQGSDTVYMSANTALSAQGAYSDGNFFVHLTDTDGDITSTAEIDISASDSIQDIISKINDSGLGVTAYIDETTGKLAIKRDPSAEAGGVLVTKGTSDFTNKIGFTSGGEQNVVTNAGSTAELISQNTATNAKFTDGNFIIQMTDKDGNVTSEHVFEVSAGDTAQKIAQMITDAGIGLTAYVDNATDKMVIKRNTDSGEGGFIIQKGTSDFTTVMNFTSGGYEIGVKDDGETASITSLYNVASAGNFTAGTFYINGTEITITEADLNSSDKIQTILDRITELTDVIATLDNQNRIVLTKKASAGEGEIEVVKGTSDFTTKFGFTSGGYQNATVTNGTTATITSGLTSYNTKVSAGDFYLQLTGDNATDAIKVTVDEGDTVGTIIDKINAMDIGITASWDSSANKIVLTRDAETGEGGINVIKGTSDFTNLVGFTSGGQQDPATVNGNTASITSSNQVGPDTAVSKGNFIIRFNGNDHVIELTDDTTIESVIDKINQIDGLTAVYDDTTKKITITRDGDSGEGNFEIIKGTSNFTTVAGFTTGGTQSSSAIKGSKASITSTNSVNDSQKFTQGDFTINLTGENAASIKVDVDSNDTIVSIVDKINALNAGVTASYDNTTGLITISRDAETGDGAIEIVKGSSNFTNVVGFTQGGSSNASFNDGEYAEITAQKSAAANQHFGAGDFTIRLTGDNASGITIDVTANDTIQSIIDKINAADAGVSAYLNDDNKLVIKRDADTGAGGIEIVKGSSSFTTDIGLTTGGDEYSGIHDAGETAKIVSKQDVSTAQGSYTAGNFFIQMLDKNGNPEANGLIQIDINQSGNTVDDINTIINNINAKNAGITASIENGKLVLTRDESLDAGSFVVLKGTSDFTNVIGLTTGGNLETGVYESGNAATHTVLTSQDLGKKLVSDSMTLGSIGVKTGTFRINGVDINVKTSDTIYDLVSRINSVFSDPKYEGIAVTASYENGEMVLRSKEASSTARITVERGTSNFTDVANFTNAYQNSSDLGIMDEGHNAHFTINGKEYDMALDLNDITDDNVYNGNNLIYLDEDGNVVTSADDASITIEVKQTGNTTIDIGRNLLNDSVEKLQSFVNRFNTAMNAAANPIMSDDTEFATFINQIKSALTSNIGSMNKITQKLADIGIIVKITGGTNSNMGTVEMSLSKTNGQYDYVEAFYDDPQKVMDLLIGDDSNPLDYSVAGSFTRLSDTLHYALENNRGGYFKVTPRSMEAQQKALKREITKTTFDLNELKNTASGDNGLQGLSEYLLQLEQQYQLINEAIIALNSQYSSSITRLVLNKNNASFNPIVS